IGCSFFFFFQAEDGIRDGHVTGVQTCALPICDVRTSGLDRAAPPAILVPFAQWEFPYMRIAARTAGRPMDLAPLLRSEVTAIDRSEERRVGNECRCGWWQCQ